HSVGGARFIALVNVYYMLTRGKRRMLLFITHSIAFPLHFYMDNPMPRQGVILCIHNNDVLRSDISLLGAPLTYNSTFCLLLAVGGAMSIVITVVALCNIVVHTF